LSIEIGKTSKQWRIQDDDASEDQVAQGIIETFLTCNSRADGSDLQISNLCIYDAYAPQKDDYVRLVQIEYYELPVWRLKELEKRFSAPVQTASSSAQSRVEPVSA